MLILSAWSGSHSLGFHNGSTNYVCHAKCMHGYAIPLKTVAMLLGVKLADSVVIVLVCVYLCSHVAGCMVQRINFSVHYINTRWNLTNL